MQQVRDWNATHASPRLVIATTSEMFHEFEKRYADKLPTFRGDFTPYWEDGVGSSARETGPQPPFRRPPVPGGNALGAAQPGPFPGAGFGEAWKNVALYSEHTWGAYNSISEPDPSSSRTQWKIQAGLRAGRRRPVARAARHALSAARPLAPGTPPRLMSSIPPPGRAPIW